MLGAEEGEDKRRHHHHHRKRLAKEEQEERLVSVAADEVSHRKRMLEMEVREGMAIADRDNLLAVGTADEVSHHKAIAEIGGMSCCCHKTVAGEGSLDAAAAEEGMRRSLQGVMPEEGEGGERRTRRTQVGQEQVSPSV